MGRHFTALIDYEDDYVQELLITAFKNRLPEESYGLLNPESQIDGPSPVLEIRQYEKIDFDRAVSHVSSHMVNSYIIRKALIRKHYLSNTIRHWVAKHKDSILSTHWAQPEELELDFAEFLDDALVEAFELRESFARNKDKEPSEREWWILKPGMSDRGQGIRLFSTYEELENIFQGWEAELPDSEVELSGEESASNEETGIMTSQLRHFIVQPYISSPLLLESEGGRKFHIRTYVVAVGSLSVYVYTPMLALFAPKPYKHPGTGTQKPGEEPSIDLGEQLTNTCLQGSGAREGSVRLFWDLYWPEDRKVSVCEDIYAITREIFMAAARGMVVHFQPLPNAFEIFGLDFLVDEAGKPWLLEVNSFPDFRQTGEDLKGLVQGLFEEVVDLAVKPFFGFDQPACNGTDRLRKVIDPESDKIYIR